MSYRAPAVFSNNTAIAAWVFALVFGLCIGLFTFILFRDGPPAGHSLELMWSILIFFWVGNAALWGFAVGQRRMRVEVGPGDRLQVIERSPFSTRERRFRLRDITDAAVINAASDDGDYFRTRIVLVDGSHVYIDEGHARELCEASLRRFNLAAGRD